MPTPSTSPPVQPAIRRRPWRAFVWSSLACCVLVSVAGYYFGKRNEERQRYQAWLRLERTTDALNNPVTLRLEPLRQYEVGKLLQDLSRQASVRIVLDPKDIENGVLNVHQKVAFEDWQTRNSQPLEVILWKVARCLSAHNEPDPFNAFPQVVISQERGRIVLTSRSLPPEPLRTQVYTLPAAMPERVVLTSAELSDNIQLTVDIDTWVGVGGQGTIGALPATVVVCNTSERHERIGQVVDRLTSLPAVPTSLEPIPLFPIDTSAEQSILASLDTIGTFNYQQTPFNKLLDDISRRFSIPLVFATKKLEEAAIDMETPITLRIKNVSLRSCLRHLLRELGLTYVIKDGFMQITTPEDACSQLYPVLYPVHDLIHACNRRELEDMDSFLQSVDRDSWDNVGGPGSLARVSHGWSLVWQTPDVHQHLEERLGLLRAKIRSPHWPPARLTPRQLAHEKILTRLEQDYRGDSAGLTFAEYFAKIQEDIGVPVLVYRWALDERRISADYRPAIDPNIQPLWRQLAAALEPSDLEFNVQDEAIVITYDRWGTLHSELLDVQGLTSGGKSLVSQSELCDLMVATIESDHWMFSALHGHLAVENNLQKILETRSLVRYLNENRQNLPRVADVRRMAEASASYQRLWNESEKDNDRWRTAYLDFALTRPAVPSQP
ncbi:MAG: hypothetical protein IAF94_15440 [Pirellulaceae bacterium]|nr:hypothetical protein [Pirellulaceae bacterium]